MPYGAVATVAVLAGAQQNSQTNAQQKKSNKKQQRLQDIKTARERRKQVQARRAAQAEVVASSIAKGTQESSVTQRTVDVGSNRAAGNIGFLDANENLTRSITKSNQKALDFQSNASTLNSVANLAIGASGTGLFDQ